MNFFKNLKARHWTWAVVLAILGIWWPAFIITSPPEFVTDSLSNPGILNFCMSVAIFGTITKIIGYLASQVPGKPGVIGVSVELAGLILSTVGPISYLLVNLNALITDTPTLVFPNSAFILAIAVLVIYIYRAIIIVPRFFFEANDSAKDN